ncbi:MAG: bile acid:sodium symporter family protein [Anaerotignum sp.]
MNVLRKIAQFVNKYMAAIVILVTIIAYAVDNSFTSWVGNAEVLGGNINTTHLLMIVMCGMGMTMKLEDFKIVLSRPKDIIFGEIAQFLIMPLIGFGLSWIFKLPPELAVGVILVGCCPGGTSSNVMTFMAKGDIALSVGMTSVSTILAPILTPLLCSFYVGLYTSTGSGAPIEVNALGMFLDIIKIVIIPIAVGLIVNKFWENFAQSIKDILPLISCTAICLIVGFVIDANSAKLFANGFLIIVVVMLHNCCGYLMGFLVGRIVKMPMAKRNAIAIEVGMQNSGMATTLAASCFPTLALATVPGAIFSAWHNISGAIAANLMARAYDKEQEKKV